MINILKYRVIQVFKNHSMPRWLVLMIDLSIVFITFIFAYLLRFNFETYTFLWSIALIQALLVTMAYFLFMILFKSYAGLIRQTTVKDTFLIAITNTSAFTLTVFLTIISREFELPQIFNIPNIYVGQAIYNSANEGQTASMSAIFDDDALLLYVTGTPSVFEPSAGYSFSWAPGGGMGGVRSYYADSKDAMMLKFKMQLVHKVVATDLGYFFSDVTD